LSLDVDDGIDEAAVHIERGVGEVPEVAGLPVVVNVVRANALACKHSVTLMMRGTHD